MDSPPREGGPTEEALTPGGSQVWLRLSAKNKFGFLNIIEPHPGTAKPFCAKYAPVPGEKGQKHLPGSSAATAREAAIKYAKFLGRPTEAPPKKRRKSVRAAGLAALAPAATADFCGLQVCTVRAEKIHREGAVRARAL